MLFKTEVNWFYMADSCNLEKMFRTLTGLKFETGLILLGELECHNCLLKNELPRGAPPW